jgi:hypothetical protein
LERRDGVAPVSRANQAAAFARISRSSRGTRISRRRRLSSSRSAVVRPSLRRPSSSPACLTHLRIALAEGSNSRASPAILRPARPIPRSDAGIRAGMADGFAPFGNPPSFSPTPSTKAYR